jgi:hypothetical protein
MILAIVYWTAGAILQLSFSEHATYEFLQQSAFNLKFVFFIYGSGCRIFFKINTHFLWLPEIMSLLFAASLYGFGNGSSWEWKPLEGDFLSGLAN